MYVGGDHLEQLRTLARKLRSFFLQRVERDDVLVLRIRYWLKRNDAQVRKLLQRGIDSPHLLCVLNKQDSRLGLAKDVFDLMRRLRRIDRHADRAVRENRVIGDRPERSALGKNRDAVSFSDSTLIEAKRNVADAFHQLRGGDTSPRLVLLIPDDLPFGT